MSESDLPQLPKPKTAPPIIDAERPATPTPAPTPTPTPQPSMTQEMTRAVPAPRPLEPATVESFGSTLKRRAVSTWHRGRRKFEETPPKRLWWIAGGLALVIVIVAAAAGGDASRAQSGAAVASKVGVAGGAASGDWMNAQIKRWRDGDLSPGGFASIDPSEFRAEECRAGAVAALEITLCGYATAAAAAGAVTTTEKSVGDHTAVVLADGQRLLVVIDRRNADPSGRTINRVANLFQSE